MSLLSTHFIPSRLASALSDAAYFESGMLHPAALRQQLDLGGAHEKLDAMKRLLALISMGRDVCAFFPAVVKNVGATDERLKRLVYIYLQHYASRQPDVALLSVNAFQKDLAHRNQYVRAQALKVLTSIRLPIIHAVVVMALSKAVRDGSAYVRQTAALAVPKVHALEPSRFEDTLRQPLWTLLQDADARVVGAALVSFAEVRLEAVAECLPLFDRLCAQLLHMEPYAQAVALTVLLRCVAAEWSTDPVVEQEEEEEEMVASSNGGERPSSSSSWTPRDLHAYRLKQVARGLLQSRNAAVVSAAAAVLLHLWDAHVERFPEATVRALLRYTRIDTPLQLPMLRLLAVAAAREPPAVAPYYREFYIHLGAEGAATTVTRGKLAVLWELARQVSSLAPPIIEELLYYVGQAPTPLGMEAARMLGALAAADAALASFIARALGDLLLRAGQPAGEPASDAWVLLCVQLSERLRYDRDVATQRRNRQLVRTLARHLLWSSSPSSPGRTPLSAAARGHALWLLGEHAALAGSFAEEALRVHLLRYESEPSAFVRLQTIRLAVKVAARRPASERLVQARQLAMQFGLVDADVDVRDASRLFESLVQNGLAATEVGEEGEGSGSNTSFLLEGMSLGGSGGLPSGCVLGSMRHVLDGPEAWEVPLPRFVYRARTDIERAPEVLECRVAAPALPAAPSVAAPAPNLEEFYGTESSEETDVEEEEEEALLHWDAETEAPALVPALGARPRDTPPDAPPADAPVSIPTSSTSPPRSTVRPRVVWDGAQPDQRTLPLRVLVWVRHDAPTDPEWLPLALRLEMAGGASRIAPTDRLVVRAVSGDSAADMHLPEPVSGRSVRAGGATTVWYLRKRAGRLPRARLHISVESAADVRHHAEVQVHLSALDCVGVRSDAQWPQTPTAFRQQQRLLGGVMCPSFAIERMGEDWTRACAERLQQAAAWVTVPTEEVNQHKLLLLAGSFVDTPQPSLVLLAIAEQDDNIPTSSSAQLQVTLACDDAIRCAPLAAQLRQVLS
ncbi:hypothetical protein CDCA_CDCA01G0462 [Cyanidium caldarium]|uniref:Clathrin/coatomer adaptor adaptin-like N-terminal domain-containing protein n=1 Tax=Cyanidium caldarium TaxID=2771 RepID=A0AAV9IQ93_CYACA|nr:hypothetical protein CDCA_CDCA01G0462 [Cyanidium caldarium]